MFLFLSDHNPVDTDTDTDDEDFNCATTLSLTYPTSSVRDDPLPPPRTPPLVDDLCVLNSPPTIALTSYPTHVPIHHYIAPGVLDNGCLTTSHPDVRRFLAQAHTDPPPPPPTSRRIFVLAALALFYHPKKPAHWLFWSRDKREETAKIVQTILNTPCLVQPPISWLGIRENLSIVANLQFGWREYLSTFAWFAPYNDSQTPSSNVTRMCLRKRKQKEQPSSSESPPQQDVQPLTKATTPPASANPTTHDNSEDLDVDTADTPPPMKRQRSSCADQSAGAKTVAAQTPEPLTASQPSRDPPTQFKPVRSSTRQKKRKSRAEFAGLIQSKTAASATPLPVVSRSPSCAVSASSSVSQGSTIVMDASWTPLLLSRSTSPQPASPSDLSAITMVEIDVGADVKADVDVKPALTPGKDEKKRLRKGKANAANTTTVNQAPASRASARRNSRNGKQAQTVTSSAKTRAKRNTVKEKAKSEVAQSTMTTTTSVAPARSKKRRPRRW